MPSSTGRSRSSRPGIRSRQGTARRQRGFAPHYMMMLACIVMILVAGALVVQWVLAAVTGEFDDAALLIWIGGFAGAAVLSWNQARFLRLPLGMWLFLAASLLTTPFSLSIGAKLGVLALVLAQLAVCHGVGAALSGVMRVRVLSKYPQDELPFYLEQDAHLLADLAKLALVLIFAAAGFILVPALVQMVTPLEAAKWSAVGSGLVAMSFATAAMQSRLWKLPVAVWAYLALALAGIGVLMIFLPELEAASFEFITYVVYLPALLSLLLQWLLDRKRGASGDGVKGGG